MSKTTTPPKDLTAGIQATDTNGYMGSVISVGVNALNSQLSILFATSGANTWVFAPTGFEDCAILAFREQFPVWIDCDGPLQDFVPATALQVYRS